jgi:hypothetical protein
MPGPLPATATLRPGINETNQVTWPPETGRMRASPSTSDSTGHARPAPGRRHAPASRSNSDSTGEFLLPLTEAECADDGISGVLII